MKALLYKEFKLAFHPICYIFILAFPFVMLAPNNPIGITFIYLFCAYPILFLGANKGQQSNDLLYSVLLPVRKKDVVLARLLTVMIMQIIFLVLMSLLAPLGAFIRDSIAAQARAAGQPIPHEVGLGFGGFTSSVGIALIGYALSDLIYFAIYYRKGKSIVASTILSILFFAIFISIFTIALPEVPIGYKEFVANANIGIQIAILGGSILIYLLIHLWTLKVGSKRLDKVDF